MGPKHNVSSRVSADCKYHSVINPSIVDPQTLTSYLSTVSSHAVVV